MSEEVLTASADLATIQQLHAELAAAQSVIGGLRRSLAAAQTERDTLYAELDRWRAASAELAQAQGRERVATEAYNQQQSSYRELETLYQAAIERAQQIDHAEAGAAAYRQALEQADEHYIALLQEHCKWVQTFAPSQAAEVKQVLDDSIPQIRAKVAWPKTNAGLEMLVRLRTLLAERQHLLRIALAAWKLSEEISEFGQSVNSETVDALDAALCDAYGDTITNWYAVRDKIVALIEPKASE